MNQDNIELAISILMAMREGKTVQRRGHDRVWRDCPEFIPNMDTLNQEFRIKPAPVKRLIRVEELPDECWVTYNGGLNTSRVLCFSTQSESIRLVEDWHELNSFPKSAKWSPSRRGPWHSFEMTEEEIQKIKDGK